MNRMFAVNQFSLDMQKHTQQQYAAMLRAAEAGLDDMERMLGVARLMLTFCTDLLCRRHEEEPALVLNNILEAHHINRFPVNNVAGTALASCFDTQLASICSLT